MSTGEFVTITIDGRPVQVAKGTGVVESALAAGVEIPVFCYEPRLGAAIGACRMCLCEVEGMPKLQAACTMTAQDGMVVRTAQTSAKAAEGQEAVLEFILVNHPLDCPVCDKGGECPLQDLTFRWGPGNTRMTFDKRTFEKPIPISPLIALDRERCILCYRCTRFSEAVSEDGQLIARNRGAQSVIATFEDEPYRAPFSGNVIELCPVGALTSTQYRFEARPWEIQNVPTVCGLCPVGCNVSATTREGKVKRIVSRNHPEVDQGWLCDKGRFAYPHLYAEDRIVDPLRRAGRRRLEAVSWDEALDEAERLLRAAGERVLLALSGSETVEQAYALSRLVRRGLGSDAVVLPEESSSELERFRVPLAAIRDANVVVVVGDEPLAERAPIVDLWVRAARRASADIVSVGPDGTEHAAPGSAGDASRRLAEDPRLRDAERAVLIWSGPGGHGGGDIAELARALELNQKPGSGAFYLPATPNGRGVSEAWRAAGEGEPGRLETVGCLIVSGDEAASNAHLRELAESANSVIVLSMYRQIAGGGWADLVFPGTSYLERDGTLVNLEGRLQRLRRAVIPPAPDELAWIAKLAERFGVDLSPYPARVFEELYGFAYSQVGEHAPLREPSAARTGAEKPQPRPPAHPTRGGGPLQLVRYTPLFAGPAVERVPELDFQRPDPEVELSSHDAEVRGVATGDTVRVSSNGTSVELRARVNRQLMAGVARIAAEHAGALSGGVEVSR
jgi:NADH-quinone oxidoreductase subunit G